MQNLHIVCKNLLNINDTFVEQCCTCKCCLIKHSNEVIIYFLSVTNNAIYIFYFNRSNGKKTCLKIVFRT